MSRFFVGQRVRKVREHGRGFDQYPSGSTGVIVEIGPYVVGTRFPDGQVAKVPADCLVLYRGAVFTALGLYDCLEPILSDGHRSCDEDFKRDLDKLLEGVSA